ncbi:unnamed protein product [Ectocarpus sp. 12 AP-2014]
MGLRIYLRYIACKWCRTKTTKMAIPFPAPPNLSTAAHCTYAPQSSIQPNQAIGTTLEVDYLVGAQGDSPQCIFAF